MVFEGPVQELEEIVATDDDAFGAKAVLTRPELAKIDWTERVATGEANLFLCSIPRMSQVVREKEGQLGPLGGSAVRRNPPSLRFVHPAS